MPTKRPVPTPEIEKMILAYVRAGGFTHVAAEAAGVPRDLFDAWMRKGEGKRPPKVYRLFAVAVRQAEAQARLGAEVAALKDKPMDWLKAGPGKETAARPGWSALAKPRRRRQADDAADGPRRTGVPPHPVVGAGGVSGGAGGRGQGADRLARRERGVRAGRLIPPRPLRKMRFRSSFLLIPLGRSLLILPMCACIPALIPRRENP